MNSRKQVLKSINNYIIKKKIKTNLKFWVPNISHSEGKRLRQNISYKLEDADYIVQAYKELDIIVIWKNSNKSKQSYSRDTIFNNLENGINFDYKGNRNHFKDKTLVYFSYTKNFNYILNLIFN